jgi:hypothetical protein
VDGGCGHSRSRASSLGFIKANSQAGGGAYEEDLIVLRKDDLNTILTQKPTLLIGRELVSLKQSVVAASVELDYDLERNRPWQR